MIFFGSDLEDGGEEFQCSQLSNEFNWSITANLIEPNRIASIGADRRREERRKNHSEIFANSTRNLIELKNEFDDELLTELEKIIENSPSTDVGSRLQSIGSYLLRSDFVCGRGRNQDQSKSNSICGKRDIYLHIHMSRCVDVFGSQLLPVANRMTKWIMLMGIVGVMFLVFFFSALKRKKANERKRSARVKCELFFAD